MSTSDSGSSILVIDELFGREEERFLDELRACRAAKALAGFTDRWKRDPRPWARQQIFTYLEAPLDRPGHEPVVKRLFKHAEETCDDALMAAFLVAFDRLVRHVRRTEWKYDWDTRSSWQEQVLRTPRNTLPKGKVRKLTDPWSGKTYEVPVRIRADMRLFSYRTRYYLRRRAWRYFRYLGYRKAEAYPQAVARALIEYLDEDVAQGEDVLDNWGMMQVCYREHPALEFGAGRVQLKENQSFQELSAAPRFAVHWRNLESLLVLLDITTQARSRLMRLWAMELVRRDHADHVVRLAIDSLMELLDHDDHEVQQFGAELLSSSASLGTLPISTWLRLLWTRNDLAVATICEIMPRHVTGDRLSLEQCVQLANSTAAEVARLGFDYLRQREIDSAAERQVLTRLADAECAVLGHELASWALARIASKDHYDVELVTPFFDSLLQEIRSGAWQWLVQGSPGYDDPVLWSRILETPFDDLRMALVDELQRRSSGKPSSTTGDLSSLWCSVLLGVHRGGRQKVKVTSQIADAMVEDPDRMEQLMPVLAVAVRSIRKPEMRAGLSAVVRVLQARPDWAAALQEYLLELCVVDES